MLKKKKKKTTKFFPRLGALPPDSHLSLAAEDSTLRPPPETGCVFRGEGGMAPLFGQKSIKIHKKARLNDIFCDFRGVIVQAIPDPELTKTQNFSVFNRNYEYFKIIVEKILYQFNQR